MTWFLLNMPLAALFFLAWTLIPLWLVSRHPDTSAVDERAADLAATDPVLAPSAQEVLAVPSDGYSPSVRVGRPPLYRPAHREMS